MSDSRRLDLPAAVWGPGDVDVLSLGVDGGDRLAGPRVPHPDRLVPAGGGQHVGLGRVPAQLVHAVPMAFEDVLLAQFVGLQTEDADGLVVATTGKPPSITAPVDTVNLGAVSGHLSGLVVLLEPTLEVFHLRTDHLLVDILKVCVEVVTIWAMIHI